MLYHVLASILTARCFRIVRLAVDENGYEVYRLLISEHRPNTRLRTLAMLEGIMETKPFPPQKDFMTCLRELEQKCLEYETNSKKSLDDDFKVAILLRCAQDKIRTQLNLQVKEDSSYAELRSVVTSYDQASSS